MSNLNSTVIKSRGSIYNVRRTIDREWRHWDVDAKSYEIVLAVTSCLCVLLKRWIFVQLYLCVKVMEYCSRNPFDVVVYANLNSRYDGYFQILYWDQLVDYRLIWSFLTWRNDTSCCRFVFRSFLYMSVFCPNTVKITYSLKISKRSEDHRRSQKDFCSYHIDSDWW